MKELTVSQLSNVNGGNAFVNGARAVAAYSPHPVIKVIALCAAAAGAAYVGYHNNRV